MITIRPRFRTASASILALALLAGCDFDGIQSVPLPGTVGTDHDSYEVIVELADVGTLLPNGEVKVDDVAVGTVTTLEVQEWHAVVTVSLEDDVHLPANAVAAVGVNSLLGSAYLELDEPTDEPARGRLTPGDTIPLERSDTYPSTEQVLSSASLVLNGGGLEQLSTITSELNNALGGNDHAVKKLIPRLGSFIATVDKQKGGIVSTIRDLDRLMARFAAKDDVLDSALDNLGPALTTLNHQRKNLMTALQSLGLLSSVTTRIVDSSQVNLQRNLRNLVPTLHALASTGDELLRGLGYALAFPFAPETATRACRGDYCNLFLELNLTTEALQNGLKR